MTTTTANYVQWVPCEDNLSFDGLPVKTLGYVNDTESSFALTVTPGRRWNLCNMPDGTIILAKATKAACEAKAENIMAQADATSSEALAYGNPPASYDEPPQEHYDDAHAALSCPAPAPTVTSPSDLKATAAGRKVLGEVIAWTPGDGQRTHANVIQALDACGLDNEIAKALLPRHAFSRACKKLETDRIIEPAPQHDIGDILAYQFTRKAASTLADGSTEWVYATEAILHVDKDTGHVWSKDAALAEKAQTLINEALEARNGGDITRIVQKLFGSKADLFPIRDQGGAYFVPFEHLGFVVQVEGFLKALGGRMNRFPIADPGSGACESVVDAVASGLEVVIQEHEQAVQEFGHGTHAATIESAAAKIRDTRVKIEAYASYLADKKDALLKAVDEANMTLAVKIQELASTKPPVAPSTPEVPRDVFGCRAGSTQSIAMRELAITTTPLTMKELFSRTGLREGLAGSCYNAVQDMVTKGLVARTGQTYTLSDKGRKITPTGSVGAA